MAITSLIAAGTAAANAELDISSSVTIVATKLGRGEKVWVHIIGLAADKEQAVNDNKDIILTKQNNSAQLFGPAIYQVYKSITAVSLGVGYYA